MLAPYRDAKYTQMSTAKRMKKITVQEPKVSHLVSGYQVEIRGFTSWDTILGGRRVSFHVIKQMLCTGV